VLAVHGDAVDLGPLAAADWDVVLQRTFEQGVLLRAAPAR